MFVEPTVDLDQLLAMTQNYPGLLEARTEERVLHQANSTGASQSDNLQVGLLQQNFVRHRVEVQVQVEYLQSWIPPDKSCELLLGHGIPDTFKLELRQPGEPVQAQHAVVSVVGGDFAGVKIPGSDNMVVYPLTDQTQECLLLREVFF